MMNVKSKSEELHSRMEGIIERLEGNSGEELEASVNIEEMREMAEVMSHVSEGDYEESYEGQMREVLTMAESKITAVEEVINVS
jgi:hypothetical protein